jgi:hypothetical protein
MEPERGRGRAIAIIALLTLGWLYVEVYLFYGMLGGAWVWPWFLAVGVGGPLGIGTVALQLRRVVTGWVYVTISMVLAVLVLLLITSALRDSHPKPAVVPQSTHCVERSGGDTRCPGG